MVAVGVRYNPELNLALESLRRSASECGVAHASNIRAEDWSFHMSVMKYGEEYAIKAETLEQETGQDLFSSATCQVSSAELVTYQDGREMSLGKFHFEPGNRELSSPMQINPSEDPSP